MPVETKSGVALGKTKDLEIEIDNHAIEKYEVARNVFSERFLISPSQVVSITSEKIIVEDNVVSEKIENRNTIQVKAEMPSPVVEKSRD